MQKLCVFICTLILLSLRGNAGEPAPKYIAHPEFKKYFDSYGVEGTFVMYDNNAGTYVVDDSVRGAKGFVPASTYKIFNSLVALESGVLPDEHVVFKWDSVVRQNKSWNHDQDMKEAIKNSTVWYYQEVARRVGRERMQHYLDTVGYGNRDCSGPIDQFWLDGNLRISAFEQVEFVKKLYDDRLPFSKRSMRIVKDIIPQDTGKNYILHRKTGWGDQPGLNVGWMVGYLEQGNDIYFFAMNLQSEKELPNMAEVRNKIVRNIFISLGLMDAHR